MEQDPEQKDIDPDPPPQDCFLVGGGFISFYIGKKSNQNGGEKNTRYRLLFHYSFCINIVQDSLHMN